MKPKNCLNCSTKTMIQISEGFGGTMWYLDFECTTCKTVVLVPCKSCEPNPLWETEYSYGSTLSTPIGITL